MIREGRNRQVRRMTATVGLPTLRLVRVAIGPYTLDGLAPGALFLRGRQDALDDRRPAVGQPSSVPTYVMSASHLRFGAVAWKSRLSTLGATGWACLESVVVNRNRRRLWLCNPCSRIRRQTRLWLTIWPGVWLTFGVMRLRP